MQCLYLYSQLKLSFFPLKKQQKAKYYMPARNHRNQVKARKQIQNESVLQAKYILVVYIKKILTKFGIP